ncbi:MAG: flagellar biosynthesis protein FlhB [Gammaproteobacteria bacterium]
MAERDDAQERTEQASAKRLEQARERGQVPRSRELATMLMLVTAAGTLWATSDRLGGALAASMRHAFAFERGALADAGTVVGALRAAGGEALLALAPLLAVSVLAAIAGTVFLGGLNFATEALAFKWERLDPIAGLGRIFSLRSVVELVKAIAKFLLLLGCGLGALYLEFDAIRALAAFEIEAGLAHGLRLSFWAFMAATAGTVLIAAIDVPYQWWEHRRGLRMSKQELREENKESDGSPEVKQRVRQMQYELANRRMMEQVPKADVVITNPTHYAVALKFDPATMAAPRLVAKGADEVALRIRELARVHRVTTLEAPPLARAVYRSTRIGHEIPAGLYAAIAQVLAYVFQLRRVAEGGARPVLPVEFPIPPELQD